MNPRERPPQPTPRPPAARSASPQPVPVPPTAAIFHIERHALHDGPGIRTLVFFKGCPLRCGWCSNPEGQSPWPELIYDEPACTGCGACLAACPVGAIRWADDPAAGGGRKVTVDRALCAATLSRGGCRPEAGPAPQAAPVAPASAACVPVCPAVAQGATGARSIVGRTMTVDEVLQVVLRDEVFYRHSGGGVTASGGEPLLQAEFVGELFERCAARGLHTAVETCGNVPWKRFERILPVTDLFLFDLKHADPAKHRAGTGADNRRILRNLRALGAAGKTIIARIPLVPHFNDSRAELEAIVELARAAGSIGEIHLLPYHRLGISKYRKLGREYPPGSLAPPDLDRVHKLAGEAQRPGLRIVVDI